MSHSHASLDPSFDGAILKAILNTAVDAIITIDTRGIIHHVNPAVERLFGYAPEELIGHNVSILMPEPDHSQHQGYLERYLATRVPTSSVLDAK